MKPSDGEKRDAELARWKRTVAQLPLTLRPSINQQLDEWKLLFPFEQGTLRRFLCGLESLSRAEFNASLDPLRKIENSMGVAKWNFSETSNTMENSEQLTRSPYYAEWRSAVRQIYSTVEAQPRPATPEAKRGRVILAVLPANLPLDAQTAWMEWRRTGSLISISGDAGELCERLQGQSGIGAPLPGRDSADSANAWWIDAGAGPRDAASTAASILSCDLLNQFRQELLAALNTIPRDTHVASETLVALKRRDWSRSWPAAFASSARLRNFVLDVYLSGNGALIFPNSFAQWAASEAFRRARPQMLVARFGVRNKPKPFTSIAVFENQSTVSTVPDIPDPVNSALDAAMLAWYVRLSAIRYPEYEDILCICVAEHLNAAWVVAPPGSGLEGKDSASPEELYQAIARQLAR